MEASTSDSVYHMTMKLQKNHIFEVKPSLHYANKSVNHTRLINFIA